MATEPAAPPEFESQITETYFFMRLGMGVLALALPFVLVLGGWGILGIKPLTSMSAYYHSDLRDVFVGVLCAIGFCLFLYKGFSKGEDVALNVAGVLAVGVAFFPMAADVVLACQGLCSDNDAACMAMSGRFDRTLDLLLGLHGQLFMWKLSVHGACAVLFFVAIAYVCIFCAKRTLHLIPDQKVRRRYLRLYQGFGVAMVAAPLAAAIVLRFAPGWSARCENFMIIGIEAAGVVVFALYWLVKTYEANKYGADKVYPNRRAITEAQARAI
jgi:hypothetical protein